MNFLINLNGNESSMSNSIIKKKSFEFSINVINTYKSLISDKREFVLSKQLLRSGTSIGANISEAQYGASQKDFINKMRISRKEANETIYWLDLLVETEFISVDSHKRLIDECTELLKMLTSTIITMERKINS